MSERETNDYNLYPARFKDIRGLSENEILHAVGDGMLQGYINELSTEDLGKLWVLSPKGISFAKTLKK